MGFDLVVRDLRLSFARDREAFIDIPALELAAGGSVCLSGPSGSGKTTLLFLLAGLERPDSGSIDWNGNDIAKLGEAERDRFRRRHIGLVFQDFHLVPELSVLENVLLATRFERWNPLPAENRRADALLRQVGLPDARQRAATLSRGEMQRLAVARALLHQPDILVADEPTASLDAANEEAVIDLLFAMAGEHGATLLVSSHQPRLKARTGRLVELTHGRLSGDSRPAGTPQEARP